MAATKKTTSTPRAYLLKGDDDFRKQQALRALLDSLVSPDFADFDLDEMEADSVTVDRVMSGLLVAPFASKQRVVLVRFANKIREDEQQKLAAKLASIPESSCLVLANPAPEKIDGRPRKGSEVIGDLSKAIRKIGEVQSFDAMRASDVKTFAQSFFFKAGKKMDSRTLEMFAQRVGGDTSVIASEAQKLIDYSGDSGHIMAEDVMAVCCETPEEKVFKLVDAVSARNSSLSMRLLAEHLSANDDPNADAPKTLATISRQFRLIWQMKLLQEHGVRSFDKNDVSDDIKSMLPTETNILDVFSRQRWMADRLARTARAFTRKDLVRCFAAIARADSMLKGMGSVEDPEMIMELLVLELSRKK